MAISQLKIISGIEKWLKTEQKKTLQKQYSTDNPYTILKVNLRDSKKERCQDRDFSRPEIWKGVETETLRDQEICWMSRPRPAETEQKLSRPRLFLETR